MKARKADHLEPVEVLRELYAAPKDSEEKKPKGIGEDLPYYVPLRPDPQVMSPPRLGITQYYLTHDFEASEEMLRRMPDDVFVYC